MKHGIKSTHIFITCSRLLSYYYYLDNEQRQIKKKKPLLACKSRATHRFVVFPLHGPTLYHPTVLIKTIQRLSLTLFLYKIKPKHTLHHHRSLETLELIAYHLQISTQPWPLSPSLKLGRSSTAVVIPPSRFVSSLTPDAYLSLG